MKTTENISLAGYAFTIETDAYEELGAYIDEIHNCFINDASADEITGDIEERIAELLSERCADGMVVNLTMVNDIKKRIGNPKELASGDVTAETTPEEEDNRNDKKNWRNRRIYRNIDERILGGVEGLFCIPMVLYICLWIAMPAARTVEQKCEMKGKPMNLHGFKSKDFDFNREVKEVAQSPAGRTIKRAGSVFLGLILLVCGLSGLLACIFIPSLPSIIDNQIAMYNPDGFELTMMQLVADTTFWSLVLVSMVLMFVGMLYGGIMLTLDLKSPTWKPGLVVFISWVLSIFVIAAWVVKTIADALPGTLI